MLPVSASISTHEPYDAVILGGGLAGLTLARQLHLEAPHIRVLVVEKRKHPVREAAFKVGESSVEIGAHYLQVVLKLESHLRSGQLEKLGLRYSSRRATIAISRAASSLARRAFRRCLRSSSTAVGSRICCLRSCGSLAWRCWTIAR